MANRNPHQGDRDDDRTTWNPADPYGAVDNRSARSGREEDRWARERSRDDAWYGYRNSEGQGQSGYSAGRLGDDRSQGFQHRNESYPRGHGSDSRRPDGGFGLDDRFTGRGGPSSDGAWSDATRRAGASESERHGASSHRGKGPQAWQRSDERIREAVNEALTDDHDVDATHLEVAVKDGEVTLTGTVAERGMKRAAEDVAAAVSGVKDVQNQIRIGAASTYGATGDKKARA